MKKILKYLLTAVIVLNSLSTAAFAETDTEATDTEREMAVSVLEKLDIISDVSDEGLKREEFALMAAKLINYAESENTRNVYFADVPIDNRFSGAVAFLLDKGAITLPEDRKFYPKEDITLAQIYKILFHLTGYGDYVNARGGFPTGCINTARDFRIDVSVKDVNSVTDIEACEIIYKFGKLGLCSANKIYSDGNIELGVDSERTLFSEYKSLYVSRGVLTNTYTNALNTNNVDEENSVIIDFGKYYCDGNFADAYFADYVEFAYIKEESSPYEGRVISMFKVPGKKYNNDKYIDGGDIVGFDNDTYTLKYENKNGKEKSEKIRTDIVVIYNGSPVMGRIEDYIDEFVTGGNKGQVHLKGYNNDNYSYMIIESYISCVIGQADLEKQTIYDKVYDYHIFRLDDYYGVSMVDHKSEKIVFSQLAAKSIINVAESKDKRFLKVILCPNDTDFSVSGKIRAITDDKDITVELDDGSVYSVDKAFFKFYENSFSFSVTYVFRLDYFGEIAYAEIKADENFRIGYLVSGLYDINETAGELKIFDSDGTMQWYKLAKKPRVDKTRHKTPLHAMAAIPGTTGIVDLSRTDNQENKPVFSQQIIRFKLNADGEICEIDTRTVATGEDKGNTLTMHVKLDAPQKHYDCENYDYMRVGKDVLINRAKTIVFNVPNVDNQGYCVERNIDTGRFERITDGNGRYIVPDDTMYNISSTFYEEYCYVDCYNYDSNTLYADVAVVRSSDRTDLFAPMMVGKQKVTLNDDDEAVIEMECYANQGKQKLYIPMDFDISGIHKGDIIRAYSYKNSNMVGKIVKVFDRETMTFVNGTGNAEAYLYGDLDNTVDGYEKNWQLSKGYSVVHGDNVIRLSYDFPTGEYDYDEVATINAKVIICDEGEVRVGTQDEIVDFAYAGSRCSTVIIHSRYSGVYGDTFVYNLTQMSPAS